MFLGIAIGVIFFAFRAHAATLTIVPANGTYAVGAQFEMNVILSSTDQWVNAVSGTVSFPAGKLSVVSVSKAGSVVDLWIQDPSYSNIDGTVTFEGAILNPGFQGAVTQILRITFLVKTPGSATVGFSLGSVLANDGQGTDVLQKANATTLSLVQQSTSSLPEIQTQSMDAGPLLSSQSHPDQGQWYANNNPQFSWSMPSDAIAVRLGYGAQASGVPTVLYDNAILSKQLQQVPDGTWYFSAQVRTAAGWSPVSRFRFNIDTEPPAIARFSVASQTDEFDPDVHVIIDARDGMSGIASYAFRIDTAEPILLSVDKMASGTYAFGPQLPGTHTIVARAYDRAGNVSEASTSFVINPIDQPRVVQYSQRLQAAEAFTVQGSTYPGAIVSVAIQRQGSGEPWREYETNADQSGLFFFATQDMAQSGSYVFRLVARAASGAQSLPTGLYPFEVSRPVFAPWGLWAWLVLVALLAGIAWLCWFVYAGQKVFTRQGSARAKGAVHMAILRVYQEAANHMRMLEKTKTRRALTREEEHMLAYFKDRLRELERVINQEIEHMQSVKGKMHEK